MKPINVIIIGGGLAGLTSALHLSIKGVKVLLIEKHNYPRHKVCGEYISNEVLPYLNSLGFNPFEFGATRISQLTLSTSASRSMTVDLPFGGFGISRYRIDSELAELAKGHGAKIVHDTVQDIGFSDGQFQISTIQGNKYYSDLVIGAYGKRSNLDMKLDRDFMDEHVPNLAVKAHYKGLFSDDLVGLHNFKGGYCGISKVENDHINVCYITDLKAFKKYKNIKDFERKVLSENLFLREAFSHLEMVFENPITISNISFDIKNPVKNHILMCGDSAGMIHPLAGNGMSMAICSSQMLSQMILKYQSGDVESRMILERNYTESWRNTFAARLKWGRKIDHLFRIGALSEIIIILLKVFPSVLPFIIRKTHGKPMKPEL